MTRPGDEERTAFDAAHILTDLNLTWFGTRYLSDSTERCWYTWQQARAEIERLKAIIGTREDTYGETISREQAIGAVRAEEECDGPIPAELAVADRTELVRAVVRATKHNMEYALRALPSIAPDPIEAERVPIEVRLAAEILCNHVEPGWENSKAIVRAWIASERAR